MATVSTRLDTGAAGKCHFAGAAGNAGPNE